MVKSLAIVIFLFMAGSTILQGLEQRLPHFVLGSGYVYAGRHSGGFLQLEYRFASYYCHVYRPQIVAISPELRALFLGMGMGVELRWKNFILIPSFTPGYYYRGRTGKDLGFPIEFRSSLEVSYEWKNRFRLGIQCAHISNASLSRKNPGINILAAILSIPLREGSHSFK